MSSIGPFTHITFGRTDPPHRVGTALSIDTVRIRTTALELFHQGRLPCHPLLLHQLAHDRFHRFGRGNLDLVRRIRFVFAENCRKNCLISEIAAINPGGWVKDTYTSA